MHFYLVLSSDLYFKIYDTPRKKLEKSASNLEVCAIVCLREKFKTFFQTQILIFGWKTIFIILLFQAIFSHFHQSLLIFSSQGKKSIIQLDYVHVISICKYG